MFKLRWYFYGVREIYYEIDFAKNYQIKIVRSKDVVQSKFLSMDEVKGVTELVKEISFPIFPEIEDPNARLIPSVASGLSICSEHADIEITWTSEDVLRCPSSFSSLEKLCDYVRSLLRVDPAKLEPPHFM